MKQSPRLAASRELPPDRSMFALLKSIFPKGLRGRAILILLFPVIMIQLIFAAIIIQRHFDRVTRQMVANVEPHIRLVLSRISSAPDLEGAMDRITPITVPVNMLVTIDEEPATGIPDQKLFIDFSGRIVIENLRAAIPSITSVNLLPDDGSRVEIRASTPHGDAIISLRRRAFSPSNPHQLLVLMLFSGFVMTLIAYLFLKNQLRPIIRLAHASKAFGQGRHVDLDVSGATEVREATRAFLGMRESIETHMEQRTQMLSNIGHDLRTPLTRLRIGLETLTESPQTKMLISDVRNMTFMVNELLDFTRDASTEEYRAVSVVELAESVTKAARVAGQDITLVKPEDLDRDVLLNARPLAITRALENLIGNAGSYAKRCRLTVEAKGTSVRLIVEDDGPGIPADRRIEAMRPFTRLDPARNLDKGSGVGLGLSIARDVAVAHGGSLELSSSETLGGLKAVLTFPIGDARPGGQPDSAGKADEW